MKNVSKIFKAIALVGASACTASGALAAPSLQAGDTIKLLDGPGLNGGGAFNASILTGAAASGSFQTFCLEYNEYFTSYGQTLKVAAVNTGAVNGGVAGQTTPTSNFDPIGEQTAYLYTKFATNSLTGYDYWTGSQSTAPTAATNDGTSLQLAFWVLENEIAYNSTNTGAQNLYRKYFSSTGAVKSGLTGNDLAIATQAKTWLDDANTQVANNSWDGIGNVRVLNLLRESTIGSGNFNTRAQDQLYMAPVPEPETYAMLLAGLGMIGFMSRRRRG